MNIFPKVKIAVKANRAVLLLDLDLLQDCLKEVTEMDHMLKTVIITLDLIKCARRELRERSEIQGLIRDEALQRSPS